jgi:hypothetical protein
MPKLTPKSFKIKLQLLPLALGINLGKIMLTLNSIWLCYGLAIPDGGHHVTKGID